MCAMAWWTESGAPSSRSERLTKIWPSRRRMVVFSEVKRRKRTAIGGIGGCGRRARYSSWKIGTKSEGTARYRVAGNRDQGTGGSVQGSGFHPEETRVFLSG